MIEYDMQSSEWIDEQILYHEERAALLRDIKDKLRTLRRIKHHEFLERQKELEKHDR